MKTILKGIGLVIIIINFSDAQSTLTWQHPLPQGNHLYTTWTFDANTAMAAGEYGTIVRTNN